jgi:hypothetical protein
MRQKCGIYADRVECIYYILRLSNFILYSFWVPSTFAASVRVEEVED